MVQPRALILRAPGTNCDEETAFALRLAGAETAIWHLNRLRETPRALADFQILCIPGGFSFGDDLAAGRIFATQLRQHLRAELEAFRDSGKLVLGICNGFQVLLKTGLLVADHPIQGPAATLTWNQHGRYEDRWVHLRPASSRCVFLRGLESLYLPIAHAEGRFVTRDSATFHQLEETECLALRYTDADGRLHSEPLSFPANPNGSQANVAGLCDPTGRVFGLMPHPERHIDSVQHPRWTRGEARADQLGLVLFRNAVEFFG